MRTRSNFLEGLLGLHAFESRDVRRGAFRQSFAQLGLDAAEDAASLLDGVRPDLLAESARVALADGFFDDLTWLPSPAAAVALYLVAGALPLGDAKRELGRRVLSLFHEGDAPTFVALACRMATTSSRGLSGAGVRARIALSLSLPASADVPVDPLALALTARRELARTWIAAEGAGSLPQRRLAARLLERAAREAARRAEQDDVSALRIFRGVATLREATESGPRSRGAALAADAITSTFRALLADRETLVWRHVACARGLLVGAIPELAEHVEELLSPELSPTEWRRGATSLVASIAVAPRRALDRAVSLLRGPLLQHDPGLATAMVWGLPRAADAEPEAAEELLRAIVAASPISVAESLVELRQELGSFGARSMEACARALSSSLATAGPDDGLTALARAVLRDLSGGEGSELGAAIQRAVNGFVTQGSRAARTLGVEALAVAEGMVSALEALDDLDDDTPQAVMSRRASVGLLRDLDAGLLESGALKSLLLLDRRATDEASGVVELDDLDERIAAFLLRREREPAPARPRHLTLHQRQLRALLHLVDGESADFGDDLAHRARVRTRWTGASSVLLSRMLGEPSTSPLRRATAATLARTFDALVRDGAADPSDVLLFAAMHVAGPVDLEILAEASMLPDVRQLLGRYAAFVKSDADAHGAADDARSDHVERRVLARIAALKSLVDEVPADASQRTDLVTGTLSRLSRALESVVSATSLGALLPGRATADRSALDALQSAVGRLGQLTVGARRRCGEVVDDATPSLASTVPLALAAKRAADDDAAPRAELARAIEATVVAAGANIPLAIADVVSLVLARLLELPADRLSQPESRVAPPTEVALPAWLPSRRTLGGFYVVRPLGGGACGTVFMVTRADERHDPSAERFALKVPSYDATAARSMSEAEFLRLFRQEAGALLSVPEHASLARFVTFDAGARPKPILVMELVEGASLDRLLSTRSLTTPGALAILDRILAGLEAMHGVGVGHLDLKPSNIILRRGKDPVLVDFGLAGRHIRPGCATVWYGAPEIWGVLPEQTTTSPMEADVYAFGCLAYEVLTGDVLFDGPSEVALISAHLVHDGLPEPVKRLARTPRLEGLASFLHGCLRHMPGNRPRVGELRAALDGLSGSLAGLPWPLAPGPSSPPRAGARPTR
jgi:hypothetical protein